MSFSVPIGRSGSDFSVAPRCNKALRSRRWHRSAPVNLSLLSACLSLMVVQGCIPITVRSTPNNADPPSADFPGMRSSLAQHSRVRVLVIHGMGTHDDDFAKPFLDALAKRLDMERGRICKQPDTLKTTYGTFSTIRRCTYQTKKGARTLQTYSLTWSRITEAFEDSILKSDWEVHGRDRVGLNRKLKKELIDQSFSDAVLYAGNFAPTLRKTVKWGLCVLLVDPSARSNQCSFTAYLRLRDRAMRNRSDLFIFSHSLGSMMVMETIGELIGGAAVEAGSPVTSETKADSIAASDLIGDVRAISMLANQIPLLYLARVPPEKKPTPPKSRLVLFGETVCARSTALPVVAYSDPNDLLSFPLSTGWGSRFGCATGKLRFINVPITNNKFAIAGYVAEPTHAHTGYWTNRTVLRFIVNGNNH